MSSRNKLKNKISRRASRGENYPRTPVSGFVSAQIATKVLTNPKYKVSAKKRRSLQARRDVVLEIPRLEAKHSSVKLALKLNKLTLAVLYRRLKQSARRAATCRNILAELSKGSQFAPPIEAQQTHELGVHKQIKAEIFSRR